MMRLVIVSLVLALTCAVAAAEPVYKFANEIPIGGDGGWDILTIDSVAQRLYLAHATKVVVIDIAASKVVGEIGDTPGVHAFVSVPEVQRGFSSNGREDKSSVVDLRTLETMEKLETGHNPDSIAYDAKRAEIYIFNHSGKSATVIDARAAKPLVTIPLDGTPEFGIADPAAGRVYCNIEDKSEVAVIDASRHQVIANWPLAPGEEPTGIALDAVHHRLFATCKKVMVMLDTDSGAVVATVPIWSGADGCAFDESTQLVFASCGEGVTIIAHEASPDRLNIIDTLRTQRGARTIALDPTTHRIFLPAAQFQPAPSATPGAPPARPAIVPNTLKLLVYEPSAPLKH